MTVLAAYEWTLIAMAIGLSTLVLEALLAARLPSWWFGLGPRLFAEEFDDAGLSPEDSPAAPPDVGRAVAVSSSRVLVTGPGSILTLDLRTPFPMVGRVTLADRLRVEGLLPIGACIVLTACLAWAVVVSILVKDSAGLLLLTLLVGAGIAAASLWGFRYERKVLLKAASHLGAGATEPSASAGLDEPPDLARVRAYRRKLITLANFVGVWAVGVALGIYLLVDVFCLAAPEYGCGLVSVGYVPLWMAFGAPGVVVVWLVATVAKPSPHVMLSTLWGGLMACFASSFLPWLFEVPGAASLLLRGWVGVVVWTLLLRIVLQAWQRTKSAA